MLLDTKGHYAGSKPVPYSAVDPIGIMETEQATLLQYKSPINTDNDTWVGVRYGLPLAKDIEPWAHIEYSLPHVDNRDALAVMCDNQEAQVPLE